jgi:Ca-activated chloride channel family protein
VDLGAASDPKAADWPKMRSELEDLLKKDDDKQQKQQNQQKQEDQKNQDNQQKQDSQQNEDQNKDQQQGQDQKQNPQQSGSQDQSRKDAGQDQQQKKPEDGRGQQNQSAFGDMTRPTPTPTPPGAREPQEAMQKVGGVRKDEARDPAMDNPELVVPLEKLERVKNQDSPAELFQLLRKGEPMPTPTDTGKNW